MASETLQWGNNKAQYYNFCTTFSLSAVNQESCIFLLFAVYYSVAWLLLLVTLTNLEAPGLSTSDGPVAKSLEIVVITLIEVGKPAHYELYHSLLWVLDCVSSKRALSTIKYRDKCVDSLSALDYDYGEPHPVPALLSLL